MYCLSCKCEFVDWIEQCPNCNNQLSEESSFEPEMFQITKPYTELVDLIKQATDGVKIKLIAAEVGRNDKWGFPYFGYGFAWVKILQGSHNDVDIDLRTISVGMEKQWGFPYRGYGLAWANKMNGNIGGNEITLTCDKFNSEKRWGFPYLGFGYAWVEKMSGDCGDLIKAEFITTVVGKDKKWGFPYHGYGFAWAQEGELTLTLK